MADAVVIGAGPNGLVGANLLADAGWDVLVLEAEDEPGGAVRSGEVAKPGFVHDRFSSFYPLAVASPAIAGLELERHGLRWRRAEASVGHALGDGSAALIWSDPRRTADGLEALAPGDGEAYARWAGYLERVGRPLVEALLTPFPPVRGGAKLAAALGGPAGWIEFGRLGVLPVRRFGEEEFRHEGARMLFTGNALHADFSPELPGSTVFGMVLVALAQQVGFPTPEGGAGNLTAALVRRLEAAGGRIEYGERAERIVLRDGRASAVRTAGGREHPAARAVLADVGAPQLYEELVGLEHLPELVRRGIRRFQYDASTVKVDWALSAPIPWAARELMRTGTVHVGDDMDDLTLWSSELARRLVPARPFLVAGQYASFDASRQPAGAETAWAYTHVPRRIDGDAGGEGIAGRWDEREREAIAARIEARIERVAPGFRDLIVGRHIQTPPDLEAADANLVGGAINGGTAQLHQQLIFRPVPGGGRPETPIPGLYLASSSAHPGGGVHGACGANAARAALHTRWTDPVRRALRRSH
jgi:phytoene dehydrogenase-like protein